MYSLIYLLFLVPVRSFIQVRTTLFSTQLPATTSIDHYSEEISKCLSVLNSAANTKTTDPELVCSSLESLEKLMRTESRTNDFHAAELLANLSGSWRLIFTTGTKETEAKLGAKVNYFPIKAVQSFDSTTSKISNSIMIGDLALIKFFGEFKFLPKPRKIEFDFDQIRLLDLLTIDLPKGKAAELGSASGLGSKNNVNLVKKKSKPFFNWISADKTIATARGGGGGLALWKRIDA